jgi:hypothetical protein
MEQIGFQVEGVGQAMGRIDAHHQGSIADPGEVQAGGRRQTGFSDASFAAEQKDAHTLILPVGLKALGAG